MKKLEVTLFMVIFVMVGCAGMLPKIQDKYGIGYEKLIKISPECTTPDLKSYDSCYCGAQMLEARSPEKATSLFLKHWENNVFGYSKKKLDKAETRQDISNTLVYGSVQRDAISAIDRISVPVLREICQISQSPYAKKMIRQLDIIEVSSQSSFDVFKEGHIKALNDTPIN